MVFTIGLIEPNHREDLKRIRRVEITKVPNRRFFSFVTKFTNFRKSTREIRQTFLLHLNAA